MTGGEPSDCCNSGHRGSRREGSLGPRSVNLLGDDRCGIYERLDFEPRCSMQNCAPAEISALRAHAARRSKSQIGLTADLDTSGQSSMMPNGGSEPRLTNAAHCMNGSFGYFSARKMSYTAAGHGQLNQRIGSAASPYVYRQTSKLVSVWWFRSTPQYVYLFCLACQDQPSRRTLMASKNCCNPRTKNEMRSRSPFWKCRWYSNA